MNLSLINILAVGAGGFLGAAGRYVLSALTTQQFPDSKFPYDTVVVNLLGSLLIGVLLGLFEVKNWMDVQTRLFIFTGILGGFTTFSTFANDTFLLLKNEQLALGLLNVGAQVILGVLFVWVGYSIIKLFT